MNTSPLLELIEIPFEPIERKGSIFLVNVLYVCPLSGVILYFSTIAEGIVALTVISSWFLST